ncbi:MAG: hypothetical protein IT289_00280 [Oligoflexia bacterium]|nr:hypothetical protein [Oligoflexia bacterium]
MKLFSILIILLTLSQAHGADAKRFSTHICGDNILSEEGQILSVCIGYLEFTDNSLAEAVGFKLKDGSTDFYTVIKRQDVGQRSEAVKLRFFGTKRGSVLPRADFPERVIDVVWTLNFEDYVVTSGEISGTISGGETFTVPELKRDF